MIRQVRATLFKEIITEVDCDFDDDLGFIVKDPNHLLDLVRDSGDEYDYDYDVI